MPALSFDIRAISEGQRSTLQRTIASAGWQLVMAYINSEISQADRVSARTAQTFEEVLQKRSNATLLERVMRDIYDAAGFDLQSD